MKNIKISPVELIILFVLGLIAQSIFSSGNLKHNGFYNTYLGFTLLIPLYAIVLSLIIKKFRLKNSFLIIVLSVLLLAVATFINISLYPEMGGSVGQLYYAWSLFYVLPIVSLPFGIIYGFYKSYSLKQNSKLAKEEKNLYDIWVVIVLMILIIPYLIFKGSIFIKLIFPTIFLKNIYLKVFLMIISVLAGLGLIALYDTVRKSVLVFIYFAIISYIMVAIFNFSYILLESKWIIILIIVLSIPFLTVYILNTDRSLMLFGQNKDNRLQENGILFLIAVILMIFEFIIHHL